MKRDKKLVYNFTIIFQGSLACKLTIQIKCQRLKRDKIQLDSLKEKQVIKIKIRLRF